VLFNGCGKKLSVDPVDQLPQEDARKDIHLLLVGAYSLLGSGGIGGINEGGLYDNDLFLNADLLASENYIQCKNPPQKYFDIASKQMNSTNLSVNRMWNKAYAAIGLCNTILENIGNATIDKQERYKGEARFIRGIVYFELLRFFGESSTGLGVPLLLHSTQKVEDIQYPSRAQIEEVYSHIIDDLTFAQKVLPETNGIYANSYSATAFLARVYLQKGDYQNAYSQSDSLIQSNLYRLADSVKNAFNAQTSKESIFEISVRNNPGIVYDGLTSFYCCDEGSTYYAIVEIDSAFISLYDSSDQRRSKLIYVGLCDGGNVTSAKWLDPNANIPVIRLAEIYLIRAEAGFRLGKINGVLNDVNLVRKRAGAHEYLSIDLSAILLERQLELAFEGHRIHDFRRIGKIVTFPDSSQVDYNAAQFVMPIPQNDINTNKNLVQNSYYR
jgi:hypothetical protein